MGVRLHSRLLACLAALAIMAPGARAAAPPRYLIFHLDAVSTAAFDTALAAGLLPNVERIFADGTRLTALTLFPASTPMIYSRLHDGGCNGDPGPIGFGGLDRFTGCPLTETAGFLNLLGRVPRLARTGFLHGIPGLDGLAALAMQSLPEQLDLYGVVEFFWFATDAYGHAVGEEAHAQSLARFDAALGAVWPRLEDANLNVIVYGDHGLTFTDQTVDLHAIFEERLPGQLRHWCYPNIYLNAPEEAPSAAHALSRPGGIDYVFYRVDERRVEGYVDGAFLVFEADGDGIRYLAESDPLGYAGLGYAGEALTPDAWLVLTIAAHYPAVPVNLFRYLQNPAVGDLVGGLNPPRIPLTTRANLGNHAGFIDTDLVVPVLVRGPDVAPLAERNPLWLHTMYRDLPELTFGIDPERERHVFEAWLQLEDLTPGALLRLSPAYRWRVGVTAAPERWEAWTEYDAFSTYLTRCWVGAGVAVVDGVVLPLAHAELEFDLDAARLHIMGGFDRTGWTLGGGVSLRLTDHLRLSWQGPTGVGLGIAW